MKGHTRFAIVTAFLTLGVIFLGPELLLRMYPVSCWTSRVSIEGT